MFSISRAETFFAYFIFCSTLESRFLEPWIFRTSDPDSWNQKSFPSPQSNTVILPRFLELPGFLHQMNQGNQRGKPGELNEPA